MLRAQSGQGEHQARVPTADPSSGNAPTPPRQVEKDDSSQTKDQESVPPADPSSGNAPTPPRDPSDKVDSSQTKDPSSGNAPTLPRHPSEVFEKDITLQTKDLVPAEWGELSDRFLEDQFTVFATPNRRELAQQLLSKNGLLLQGPQGVGKSFFAAGLVGDLRRLQPQVPVVYLPMADFTGIEARQAVCFALQKAGRIVPPALSSAGDCLKTVTAEMEKQKPIRLVIDQMNTAYRPQPQNRNYKTLKAAASWYLLVTSLTTTVLKLDKDYKTVEYDVVQFDKATGTGMLRQHLQPNLQHEADQLYDRTGGNPLELGTLGGALQRKKPSDAAQLEALTKEWFAARCDFVCSKLDQLSDGAQKRVISAWAAKRPDGVDPRFFFQGETLFPAAEVAMQELAQNHRGQVPTNSSKFGKVYETAVRKYLEHNDIFGWQLRPLVHPSFQPNKIPADFEVTLKSKRDGIHVWFPEEDGIYTQRDFDFVYAIELHRHRYVAWVQCCGFEHRDTYSSFARDSLDEWRSKLPTGTHMEYVWLSHSQPTPSPLIRDQASQVFPPPGAGKRFEEEFRCRSASVLAAPRGYDRWMYHDTSRTALSVSLKYISLSQLDPTAVSPPEYWVDVVPIDDVTDPKAGGNAIRAQPFDADITSLETWLFQNRVTLPRLSALATANEVAIYEPTVQGWSEVTDQSSKLVPTSKEQPYRVAAKK